MTTPAPDIDTRTISDIDRALQDLVKVYAPAWKEFDPLTGQAKGVSGALIGIFARYTEVIIQRLNQVPQKNFLAFLDMLGAALLPPQPARVPLTFSLAAGSAVDGLVPVGTQVAAPPAEGEKNPTIFETERELVVTAAQLESLFVRDPEQDEQADRSSIIASAPPSGVQVFQGNRPIEHVLYLGHGTLLGFPRIVSLRLTFTLESTLDGPRQLSWELWDGSQWQTRVPSPDQTQNLSASGNLLLGAVAPPPESQVNGIQSRWLRGRLITPITIGAKGRLNMVHAADLPKVRGVLIEVQLLCPLGEGLAPEFAFNNTSPIELGNDFFPFGEQPKLSDAFYLASTEAFSKDTAQGLAASGARVQLDIGIGNSHLVPSTASVRPSSDLQLSWECWNGSSWERVGTSNAPPWLRLLELEPTREQTADTSIVLQGRAEPDISLVADVPIASGGLSSRTVRVGEDGRFATTIAAPLAGLNVITFTATRRTETNRAWSVFFREIPPQVVRTIELSVQASQPSATGTLTLTVGAAGAENANVTQIRVTNGSQPGPVVPVVRPRGAPVQMALVEGRNELLIEGLSATSVRLAATTLTVSRPTAAPPIEASTGFIDGTHALSQSGIVSLTLPTRVASTAVNGQESFWLRVRISRGSYGREAGFKVANPEAPEQGFALILESFRPPSVSSLRIGYGQTLAGPPDTMLTQNNSNFVAVTNAVKLDDPSFEPYLRAPEDRPTLYAGFTMPAARPLFPNRTISVYTGVAGFRYGERSIPISPDISTRFAAAASTVSHRFFVTNAGTVPATFTFSVLGTKWLPAPAVLLPLDLNPGESRPVDVTITVPVGAPPGESDTGFLQVEISTDPGFEYTATFITFAGPELPTPDRLRLVWEYWNGRQYTTLTVRDDTENLTRSGLIEFLAPSDFTTRSEFGLSARFWLRVRWDSGEYTIAPRVRRMLLNTTMAAQTVTVRNETLGSSDGSANQRFRSTQAPILNGQRLEVREPEMPSASELEMIARDEGDDAVTVINDTGGRPKEILVRWHEGPDFYGSGPRSRHYVLDHLTGEIRTGDGLNGMIPPAGIGNIRLESYQTGGGNAGNRAAGAIVQLKTTVPYVDKVTNTEAAEGGADAETLDSLLTRAPRTIRHRNRAVTVEDYEDLAMLASPAVARARCIPLRNLIVDPLGEDPPVRGEVSVIIVPRSIEAKPQPSLELLNRVEEFLVDNSVPTAHVSVVGPLYFRVDVKAEISLASLSGASVVEQAVQQNLAAFLHPLTGGLDGTGWDFGRKPHRSDLFALLEAIAGVDHIRFLEIIETEDQPGVSASGRFLVFSGTHTISLVFEG